MIKRMAAVLFSVITFYLLSFQAIASQSLTVRDAAVPGKVSTLSVNSETGKGIAVSADGKMMYLVDAPAGTVSLKVKLPSAPIAAAVDIKRNQAIVAYDDGSVSFIDLGSGAEVNSIAIGEPATVIAVSDQADIAVIGRASGVSIVNLATASEDRKIALPVTPEKIVALKNGIYVLGRAAEASTGAQQSLILVDALSGDVLKQVSPDTEISDMALDEKLNALLLLPKAKRVVEAYRLDLKFQLELVIDAANSNPAGMSGIAVNPVTDVVVATDALDNKIYVFSLESKAVNTIISSLEAPTLAAIDWSWNTVYVSHKNGLGAIRLENPLPQLNYLVPDAVKTGNPGFTLSLEGSRFVRDSAAKFNSIEVPTKFNSSENLKVEIASDNLFAPGFVPVTVANPGPGGGTSNALMFRILDLAPEITGLLPDVMAVNTSAALRVTGKNFFNGSTVLLNNTKLATRFISSQMVEADVPAGFVSSIGDYAVIVVNPIGTESTSKPAFLKAVDGNDPLLGSKKNSQAVTAVGSLKGKILNTGSKELEGVAIRIKNQKVFTDSHGNFQMDNIPAGKHVLLLDGSTAKDQAPNYPTIPVTVDIQAGKINELSFQPYLHSQKKRNFKSIEHAASFVPGTEAPIVSPKGDLVITDPELPGVEMTIPKGVKITGWDGKTNKHVSMRTVPADRLPLKPLPENSYGRTVYMFYFDKVGGGVPDQPIPFKSPNDLGLMPGEKAILWYYDESPNDGEAPNDWTIAGTGTVTPDGKYIVTDPGVGLQKFCCGATVWGGSGMSSMSSAFDTIMGNGSSSSAGTPAGADFGNGNGPAACPAPTAAADPVDVTTGYFQYSHTDYRLNSVVPVDVTRYYRSGDAGYGGYGYGTYYGYDWYLVDYTTMIQLIMPGNYQASFSQQADGTFVNTTDGLFTGAVFIKNGDGTYVLKTGSGWKYSFNTGRVLVSMTDPNNNTLTLMREFETNVTRAITPEGQTVTFDVTAFYRDIYTKITGPDGNAITYTYYTGNLLKSVQYPDGSSLGYEYDANGRMNKVLENGKTVLINEYDTNNRVTRQTRGDGGVYQFGYVTAGGLVTQTTMTAPSGAVTTWRFNSYRYVTEITTPDGVTTYTRDPASNKITAITDVVGRVKSFAYDTTGRVTAITDNAGNSTGYEYEDVHNNVAKVTDALASFSTYSYDGNGNLLSVTGPDSKTVSLTYNSMGKPLTVTDPIGKVVNFSYDGVGNILGVTDPLGNSTSWTYDSMLRPATVADAKGKASTYAYDSMWRPASVTDPMGNKTRVAYDLGGGVNFLADAKNRVTTFAFDGMNRPASMTNPLFSSMTTSWDNRDNIALVTDKKSQTTTFQYDVMDRLTRATFADSNYTEYGYDGLGRVTSVNDSVSGLITYTYTDSGCGACSGSLPDLVASETTPLGTVSYTYDAIGRRTSMTVQGQPTVYYGYDSGTRLSTISTMISGATRTFSISYDGDGRRATLNLPNGVTTSYGYDDASRLISMVSRNSYSTVIEAFGYTLDANGNRTAMTRQTGTAVIIPSLGASTVIDEANQMLVLSQGTGIARSMEYDANGNLTSVTNGCGVTSFTWDVRSRLVAILGYGPSCTALSAAFAYDTFGRRISKTINGTTTQFLYDGADIVLELQGGVVTTNYIRTMGVDEPLAIANQAGIYYYIYDGLGSVVGLTDSAANLVVQYTYDSYGNTSSSNPSFYNPFQFTGRENDGTELYYYRARYYSPEMQRFVSEDALGFGGGDENLYRYVENQPVNRTDPSGLWYLDMGVNGSATGVFGPGGKAGMKIGTHGITLYYSFGLGIGASSYAVVMKGEPCSASSDISVKVSVSGGVPIEGIPLGGKWTGGLSQTKGLTQDYGGGFGVGFGVSVGVIHEFKIF